MTTKSTTTITPVTNATAGDLIAGSDLAVIQAAPPAAAAAAYLASLNTEVGRSSMRSALNRVARIMGMARWEEVDWSTLNAANVKAVMSQIDGAPATRNRILSAIKGVAAAAWDLRALDTDTYMRIKTVPSVRGSRLKAGRYVSWGEVESLLRSCANDPSAAAVRDAATISLARGSGLRREELVDLRLESFDPATGAIRLIGKGDKERLVYAKNGTRRYIDDWLAIRGAAPGALFCEVTKACEVRPESHISTTALHKALRRRAHLAGVINVSWHDFRRSWVSDLLDKGVDIATVAELAGHSSTNTTKGYDRRPERAREQAAGFISVPYFGRGG